MLLAAAFRRGAFAGGEEDRGDDDVSRWIRRFHKAPDAPVRLVCFPHAGGSAGTFVQLSAAIRRRAEVLAVQYPGRQDRFGEPCATGADEVVDAVLHALAQPEHDDPRPLGLFGHSMGAVLAFETARRMERAGTRPAALFVSARQGPSLPWPPPGVPTLHDADPARILNELRLLGGSAAELLTSPEVMEYALPALRADYRLLHAYAYQSAQPLQCPVIGLAGADDPRVPGDGVRAWARETRGPFAHHVLPGGHFYIENELPQVTEIITDALA
ncbi:thioesterase II family protein [Streptomyces sp. NPDC001834]|uniref:thioesterase II family protein n=1 Tax=Streptomyces sp. NPDC001834 TaxID=3364616 RepID=UPI003698A5DD